MSCHIVDMIVRGRGCVVDMSPESPIAAPHPSVPSVLDPPGSHPPAHHPSTPHHSVDNCMPTPLIQSLPRLTLLNHHQSTRKMSTLIQYLVLVKDFPGTKPKRIQIREQHLAAVKNNTSVKAGGSPPKLNAPYVNPLVWPLVWIAIF